MEFMKNFRIQFPYLYTSGSLTEKQAQCAFGRKIQKNIKPAG